MRIITTSPLAAAMDSADQQEQEQEQEQTEDESERNA